MKPVSSVAASASRLSHAIISTRPAGRRRAVVGLLDDRGDQAVGGEAQTFEIGGTRSWRCVTSEKFSDNAVSAGHSSG